MPPCGVLWAFTRATPDSAYWQFTNTCGNRHAALTVEEDCTGRHGCDVDLDALVDSCQAENYLACDILCFFSRSDHARS